MPTDKAGRVVFIGNIPYGLTEEQVIHLFSSCGEVLHFRLVYDKDSGRPKGFGFAEFADADSAASAVRNLNNHEIMNRTLRVDYSNDDGAKDSGPSNQNNTNQQPQIQFPHGGQQTNGTFQQQQQQQQGLQQNEPLPAPPGIDLPPNITATDAISRTLASFEPAQLLDLVSQMKNYVSSDPRQATAYLSQNQNLCYAIFQALLLLGLVDQNILGQVVQPPNQQQQAPQPTNQFQPPPPVQFQQPHHHHQQQQTPQHYPPPPQPPQMPGQFQGGFQQPPSMPTPPVQQGYPPPKPPNLGDEAWQQITALCMLPQAQVDSMQNRQERDAVNNIRSQYRMYFTGQAAPH